MTAAHSKARRPILSATPPLQCWPIQGASKQTFLLHVNAVRISETGRAGTRSDVLTLPSVASSVQFHALIERRERPATVGPLWTGVRSPPTRREPASRHRGC